MHEPEVDAEFDVATDVSEPGEIEKFWDLARFHAKLNVAPGYFGPTALEVVTPPAFSLGETPTESDEELVRLVTDAGTTLRTPVEEYGDERPEPGLLGIVLDGSGHPRALVETVEVREEDGAVLEELRLVYGA